MDIDGVLIMNSENGLPLFSKLNNIDETLFSGLITAIQSFIKELRLGGLSSFSTDKKYIFVTGREQITTCLISQKNIDFKEIYSLSIDISLEFEKMFKNNFSKCNDVSMYNDFDNSLEQILSTRLLNIPYILKVAEFAKKEFGENISYQPVLKNKKGKPITFDLVIDKGQNNGSLKEKILSKMHKSFSRDTIFVKTFDNIAGRAQVEECFEIIKSFDTSKADPDTSESYGYFPRKLVIFAPDYSPTVFEAIRKLKRVKSKPYISPRHLMHMSKKMNEVCYIELWQWADNSYPIRKSY